MGKACCIGAMIVNARKIEVPSPVPPSLPDGFAELEYIESTGTQYVDTGFMPNNNTSILADAQLLESLNYATIFASRNQNEQMYWIYNNGSTSALNEFVVRVNTGKNKISNTPFSERYAYEINDGLAKIGENSVSISMGAFQSPYSIFLFGANNKGSLQYPAKMRLYSCQIYDNGSIARDYVPCTNPQGEIGLYDLVGKQFYGNAGTGVFTAGQEVGA